MRIGDLISANARHIPDKEGLIWKDERITWAMLNRRVNRLANSFLGMGIKPGERIAFLLDNCKEIVELYFSIAKIGCIACPIMPRSVGREIAYIVNNIESVALLIGSHHKDLVAEIEHDLKSTRFIVGVGNDHSFEYDYETLVEKGSEAEPGISVNPDSICTIFHTSGTTGNPKGCILTHRNKVLSRLNAVAHIPHLEDDRALIFYPLTLSLTSDLLLNHVLCGIPTVLLPAFDASDVLRTVEKECITTTYVIESTFDQLVESPELEKYDLSSLRYFYATSATKDISNGIKVLNAQKGFRAQFWNGYGSTEGGGWITQNSPFDICRSLEDSGYSKVFRSIGREAMLVRVDFVDEAGKVVPTGEIGEMTIDAPWLFSGYWNQPEQTREALKGGCLYTGDLGRKDENDFIFLEGRKKDMIKTGGVNVYPVEIEHVLKGHACIKEAAVVGIPDKKWGEKVVACIVLKTKSTEEDILSYCADKLAGFKRPKSVVFFDRLPTDKPGKILKRKLREEIIQKSEEHIVS